ncbi:MAG: hypothetical protein CL868_17065 [Cytophagaceae bacterium]|nr:hypothetical protein [Cytophagaceae bacterium]|tara:strand:+ start:13533 stop:13967 length:435 start_codon:yes stop_codon:yes gene_type:complete
MGSPEILAVPYALASGKSYDTKLSDLTDVSGSANTGNYLQYNGSTWTPGDVAESPWTEASGELYYEGNVGIANTNPDEELVIGTNLGMNWSVPAMTVGSNSTATGGAISLGYNTTSPRRLHISSIGGVNTIATENAIGLGKEPP